jgi:hypothetical protein
MSFVKIFLIVVGGMSWVATCVSLLLGTGYCQKFRNKAIMFCSGLLLTALGFAFEIYWLSRHVEVMR